MPPLRVFFNCLVIDVSVPFALTLVSCAEFSKIALATSMGFLIMGFIGFFVKLVHIPINNILIGHA